MPWVKRILAVGKIRRAVLGGGSALEFAGYSVAYAEDVETACELMASIKFDLVVLSRRQNRALSMMMEIKQRHPNTVLAMIHPYPDEDAAPVRLPPKGATLRSDDLINELRFLFDSGGGKLVRKRP
jgi:DNA-binding NtrC family response regulator